MFHVALGCTNATTQMVEAETWAREGWWRLRGAWWRLRSVGWCVVEVERRLVKVERRLGWRLKCGLVEVGRTLLAAGRTGVHLLRCARCGRWRALAARDDMRHVVAQLAN